MWKTGIIVGGSLLLGGCAVGRTDAGDIVLGMKAGSMPETVGEFAQAASAFLPPPWNLVVGGAATLLLGGTAATAAAQKKAKTATDAAWDEAESRAYARMSVPPGWIPAPTPTPPAPPVPTAGSSGDTSV